MCGIVGILSLNPSKVNKSILKNMTDSLIHRGPDGEGQWIGGDGHIGLGHRRLSILDLSADGAQPMHYLDRYSITHNGEIYNYIELKEKLIKKGYSFKSTSDTEVLLALYHDKKEQCLQDLDGMFAFAIYDKVEKTVFCARDRFGEKPFFYYHDQEQFVFGSEMKALWANGVPKVANHNMIYNYLQFDLLENPKDLSETFYNNILKLPPSSYLIWKNNEISIQTYWSVSLQQDKNPPSLDQACLRFRELFYESVSRRLRSDVLVGSSLSGGIDSSLVVCAIDKILEENKNKTQNTFSARFKDFHKDEGEFIAHVKRRTNIRSHEVYSEMNQLENELDKIFYHQEEPFGSASILVQYQVYELAKKYNVTVLLDGQGADEIMAGYHFYFTTFFNELRKKSKKSYEEEFSSYNQLHQDNLINAKINKLRSRDSIKGKFPNFFNSFSHKVISMRQKNNVMMDQEFFNHHKKTTYNKFEFNPSELNEHLNYSTFKLGLPTLLRYADRNSMAHSREVRLPFLSHELVEFLFSLPSSYKIHQGWTKYIMRKSFQDLLPSEIAWRKDKIGFEPPQQKWMENPNTVEKIVEGRRKLVQQGILDKKAIDSPIRGNVANAIGDGSWNHLMAAKLFDK